MPSSSRSNEPQRLALYKLAGRSLRAYANLANEMREAGYTDAEAADDQGRGRPLREGLARR